ncbi:MAG: hypothetical protein ACYDAN_10470 [Candidatus Limnocylindrales bacterium]
MTDQYLDMLLAQVERRAAGALARTLPRTTTRTADCALAPEGGAPTSTEPAEPDAARRHAGAVLRATLLRAHPSFRFEERLAAQLADLAAPGAPRAFTVVAGRSGDIIPFPAADLPAEDPLLAAVLAGELDPSDGAAVDRADGVRSPSRPLLVGGAITSAAISLVGVAWVAWRASHPAGASMGRAARAAHARRIADLADLATGIPGGPA